MLHWGRVLFKLPVTNMRGLETRELVWGIQTLEYRVMFRDFFITECLHDSMIKNLIAF